MKKLIKIVATACIFIILACALIACNNKRERDELPTVALKTSYEITAVYSDGVLTATQTVNFVNNTGDELDSLKFNLYPNAFREDAVIRPVTDSHKSAAYYDGDSFGGIEFSRVLLDGKTAQYEIAGVDENTLIVETDTIPLGGKTEIIAHYKVTLPKSHTRFGVTSNGVNLCNFYPVLCAYSDGWTECPYYPLGDPFISDVADYSVTLTFPSGGELSATGKQLSAETAGNTSTYSFSAENVRDFAAVYLENGKRITTSAGDTLVHYIYDGDKNPTDSLNAAVASLSLFERLFGDYPYPVFTVADCKFIYGGMEYPNLVLINDSLTGLSREYTIAHETAHQWWYGLVGSDSVNNAWQDEGLTEFSTALYFKHTSRKNVFDAVISNAAKTYAKVAADMQANRTPLDGVMTRSLNDFPSESAYIVTAYDKGLLLHHTLYTLMGEEEYLAGLRIYFNACYLKNATVDDFISALPSCRTVIENWLLGKVIIASFAA